MAMEAKAALRPFVQAAGGDDGEVISGGRVAAAATVFFATERAGRAVDPVIWGEEKRMKREIVTWAKAVAASIAAAGNGKNSSCSSTPSPPPMRSAGYSVRAVSCWIGSK